MKTTIIDIRTSALPEEAIAHLMPEFKAPATYKDEDKIANHVAKQKAEWLDKAAFSALTGRVVAVGTRKDGQTVILDTEDESAMLANLWCRIEEAVRDRRVIVGFDLAGQKLPFLARRSWALGTPLTESLFPQDSSMFVDLLHLWRCGDRHEFISLRNLGKFLGVNQPATTAPPFATTRASAVAGLTHDLALTAAIMERMLGVSEVPAKDSPPAGTAPCKSEPDQGASRSAPSASGAETLVLEQSTSDDY